MQIRKIMDVFEAYDNQIADHLNETEPMMFPLQSWDVHLNNLDVLSKMYKDIIEIQKKTEKLIVDVDIVSELKENAKIIIITDINLNIEFASANILQMTGYMPSEILGKSPKIFQGPNTQEFLLKKIRRHVNGSEPFNVTIVNYKKNKSLYSCHIKGYPIFDKKGTLVKYVAVEEAA